jgi:hypothetical protein
LKRFAQNEPSLQKEQPKAQLADKHAKLQEFQQVSQHLKKRPIKRSRLNMVLREQVVDSHSTALKKGCEVSKAKES